MRPNLHRLSQVILVSDFAKATLCFLFAVNVVLMMLVPFPTSLRLVSLGQQASMEGIVSLAMMVVFYAGGLDLSLDAIFASCLVSIGLLGAHMPLPLAVLLGVLIAVGIGWINGSLATSSGKSILSTFLMTFTLRGAVYYLTGGTPFTHPPLEGSLFNALAWVKLGYFSSAFLAWLITAVIFQKLLVHSMVGRNLLASGASPQAAAAAGIPVQRYRTLAFVVAALLVAVAAVMQYARLYTVSPSAGSGYTFHALAALIIGNGGLRRVYPSVIRVCCASLLLTFLAVQLGALGLPPDAVYLVSGGIVLSILFLHSQIYKRAPWKADL